MSIGMQCGKSTIIQEDKGSIEMPKFKPMVAVDFDGVIHEYNGWKGYDYFDEPLLGAKEFLQELDDRGYEVIIHTARNIALVDVWLRKHKMLYSRVTNHKPPAIAYVDDRAVRFEGDYIQALEGIKQKPWWKEEK
jgi:hypothetical protein